MCVKYCYSKLGAIYAIYFTVSYLDAFITPMLELDRREGPLLFHKNGCHTPIGSLRFFVIAISVQSQGWELQRNTELAFTSPGDDLVAFEFGFKRLPRKVLGWFVSTWSTVVYTNNFPWKDTCQFLLLVWMISKLSFTIFHWQGFWAWTSFPGQV